VVALHWVEEELLLVAKSGSNKEHEQKTKRVRLNKSIDWYDIEQHDSGNTYWWRACR